MQSRGKQAGLSMLGWLAVIVLFASIITLVLRLGPHYIDFRTIDSMMSGLSSDPVHTMTKQQVRDLIQKRLTINNIRDLKIRDVFQIDRTRDNTTIKLNYEVREHIFYNVDVVLAFDRDYVYQ